MADLVIASAKIPELDRALAALFPLAPPPTPKGRYALSKVAGVVGPAHATYRENYRALLLAHAITDADGKPIARDLGDGRTQYDLGRGFGQTTPEFDAALAELNDEPITLPGCRMITHAELGACPITVQQEQALIAAGILEDKEPE